MNTEQNLKKFRRTLGLIAILALVVFGGSTVLGTFISNKDGGSLASYNLAGISTMMPAIMPSILVGVASLILAMLVVGKFLGNDWRETISSMVDHDNNDSIYVLSERIALAAAFAALTVPMMNNFLIWSLVLLSKLVVLLVVSILIATVLSALIFWASDDPNYEWWQVDRWWLDMMDEEDNDMIARLTGLVFQLVGIGMFGALLVANI